MYGSTVLLKYDISEACIYNSPSWENLSDKSIAEDKITTYCVVRRPQSLHAFYSLSLYYPTSGIRPLWRSGRDRVPPQTIKGSDFRGAKKPGTHIS